MAHKSSGCRRDQNLSQEVSVIQIFADLFKNEGNRRQWRIECASQSRSSTTQKRRPPSFLGNAKPPGNIGGERPGEMNGRTFSSQTATASDREHSRKELRYHYIRRHKSEISPISH